MSNETNTKVEEKKALPIKECCLVLAGIILGIVISYGLFASALKDAADDLEVPAIESQTEESTSIDS